MITNMNTLPGSIKESIALVRAESRLVPSLQRGADAGSNPAWGLKRQG